MHDIQNEQNSFLEFCWHSFDRKSKFGSFTGEQRIQREFEENAGDVKCRSAGHQIALAGTPQNPSRLTASDSPMFLFENAFTLRRAGARSAIQAKN